ncbi:MAG: sugar-binding protein [bacterium]|nr:sugar-binding protein [bacterium]
MQKTVLTLLFLGSATMLLAEPTYLCQKAIDPIVVDGLLDEASWQKAKALPPMRDLSGKPARYECTIQMTYDDEYLYFAAILPTPNINGTLTERDSIIYHDDDFEIFIDPTNTGRNYLELEINALNTVWDLFLTAPYRDGNACIAIHDWDIKGLKHAVSHQGTLNHPNDVDTSWTVEIAWPWKSITHHATLPRTAEPPTHGQEMRFNFSRVDHPIDANGKRGEVNTVWSATRQVTIHAPEQWGRVRFSKHPVGTPEDFPPTIGLWVHGNDEKLTENDLATWAAAGVNMVVIDGKPENVQKIARWAKKFNMTTVAWLWTLNRPGDKVALTHPEWYAVSAEGKSCWKEADRPFVPYYQFLCPSALEVRTYLTHCAEELAAMPEIDAIQLDYIRQPDLVLPTGLWKNYNLDMSQYLAPYDFCYCQRCQTNYGKEANPQDAEWIEYRLNAVAETANAIASAVRAKGKRVGAAVFPTPEMSAAMVFQAWDRFQLDFAYPMLYAKFYEADTNWILSCLAKGQAMTQANYDTRLYPGLHLPDFTEAELKAFLKQLLDVHPHGFCLFSHEELTPTRIKALKEAL